MNVSIILIDEQSHHKSSPQFPLKSMVISIFLKVGMIKFLKSPHNVADVKNVLLPIIKVVLINIIFFKFRL